MFAILDIIFAILLTAMVYGVGHVLFIVLRKSPITKKRLRIYCVLLDMAVHLLCIAANSLMYGDSSANSSPAVLWWIIWYNVTAKQLQCKGLLLEHPVSIPKEQYNRQESEMRNDFQGYVVDESTGEVISDSFQNSESPTNEVVLTYRQDEKNSISSPPSTSSKRRFQRAYIAFSAACAVLLICICVLGYHTYSMSEKVKSLTTENEELSQTNETLKEKNSSLLKDQTKLRKEIRDLESDLEESNNRGFELFSQLYNIGFIVDGSQYYHRFDCAIYTNADSYWAHNIEYCKYYGYKECPLCWK